MMQARVFVDGRWAYIYIYVRAVENLGLRRGDGKKMETSVQGVGVKGFGHLLPIYGQD